MKPTVRKLTLELTDLGPTFDLSETVGAITRALAALPTGATGDWRFKVEVDGTPYEGIRP